MRQQRHGNELNASKKRTRRKELRLLFKHLASALEIANESDGYVLEEVTCYLKRAATTIPLRRNVQKFITRVPTTAI